MSTPIGAGLHRQTTGGGGPVANTKHHQILIVGGGTAGVTVAASLRRRGPRSLDIAVVEPSETHYYQPCFTLVGAGAYDMAKTQRPERNLIPAGVTLIHGAAKAVDPDKNSVMLETGDALTYDYLVVCTGMKLDWDKIEGLSLFRAAGWATGKEPKTRWAGHFRYLLLDGFLAAFHRPAAQREAGVLPVRRF
jgi:NADPH-dependent 2,4-dienoyl-CoA reductase/sulfur reductase-like enzyme